MATGFGAPPTKNSSGAVTSGTTDADIRKIYGGLFSPGIISGATVNTSSSNMSYTTTTGVVAIKMANNEVVLAPVPAQTVTPTATGNRTDIVYAYQNIPSSDGDSEVVIKVGTSLPSVRAVELARFSQTSTNTRSNQGVRTADRLWAIPYGSGLGTIYWHRNTLNGTFSANTRITSATFTLPTDRLVRLSLRTTLSADGAYRFDDAQYCEAGYAVNVDGAQVAYWRSPGLHQGWQEVQFEHEVGLLAGQHTIFYERRRVVGPGTPFQHYGEGASIGAYFRIEDGGVIR